MPASLWDHTVFTAQTGQGIQLGFDLPPVLLILPCGKSPPRAPQVGMRCFTLQVGKGIFEKEAPCTSLLFPLPYHPSPPSSNLSCILPHTLSPHFGSP